MGNGPGAYRGALWPSARKPKHSIFGRKLRHPDTLKDFIKRAASAPSVLRMSKLTDELGHPTGRPCLLIVRLTTKSLLLLAVSAFHPWRVVAKKNALCERKER
jgi:hypothetical protein